MNCKWRAVKVDEYGGSFVLHSFTILKGASLPHLKYFMEKQSILDPGDIEEAAGSGYFDRRENTLPFVERVLGIMGRLKDPKVGSTKLDLPWQAIADKICGVETQEAESIGSTVRSRKRAQPPEGGAEGGKTEDNPANEGPSKKRGKRDQSKKGNECGGNNQATAKDAECADPTFMQWHVDGVDSFGDTLFRNWEKVTSQFTGYHGAYYARNYDERQQQRNTAVLFSNDYFSLENWYALIY